MRVAAYDLETTGLSPRFAKIIQLGVCTDADELFCRYTKTVSVVPKKITQITGITTKELLRHGVTLATALREFGEFLRKNHVTVLLGYNCTNFDNAMLFAGMQDIPLSPTGMCPYIVDILPVVRILLPGLKSYKLTTVYNHLFGRNFPCSHRADHDARATMEVVSRLGVDKFMHAKHSTSHLFYVHCRRMDRLNGKTQPSFHERGKNHLECARCGQTISAFFIHTCTSPTSKSGRPKAVFCL